MGRKIEPAELEKLAVMAETPEDRRPLPGSLAHGSGRCQVPAASAGNPGARTAARAHALRSRCAAEPGCALRLKPNETSQSRASRAAPAKRPRCTPSHR